MSTPELTVTLSGGYYLHSYRRVLQDLEALLHVDAPTVVNLDMKALTFVGPAAMATIVMALMRVRDSELFLPGGKLTMPDRYDLTRYLMRMDFFTVLFHDSTFTDNDRSEVHGLLECQHFTDDKQLREIVKKVISAIQGKVPMSKGTAVAFDTALSEMLENVIFHAYTDHGAVVAVQTFTKGELEVAILDLGIGVKRSLALNPQHAHVAQETDIAAIGLAMTPNITSTPERNSGWGLAFTERLLKANGGRLIVRSGRGVVTRGAAQSENVGPDLPGTLIAMRIKTDTPLNADRAWTALLNDVGRLESNANA